MPEKPTPKWAADVIKLLSLNPLRVEILRQLAQQPEGITSVDRHGIPQGFRHRIPQCLMRW